jgi:hypothetical protein
MKFAAESDESSHLCSLGKSFPFVGASFEGHQDLESEAYSNVDMEASETSLGAGLTTLKEMMIPPTLFQCHFELSSLSVGDLVEAADRLDKSCILSSI